MNLYLCHFSKSQIHEVYVGFIQLMLFHLCTIHLVYVSFCWLK